MSIDIKLSLVMSLFFSLLVLKGQPLSEPAENANYVVIGAYANRTNGVNFTNSAKADFPDVRFEINPARQLYYVYMLRTDNRVQAFAEARKLRKESKYSDTWVFYGTLGEVNEAVAQQKTSQLELNGNQVETKSQSANNSKVDETVSAKVKAYSMAAEPTGLDLDKMKSKASSAKQKEHYQAIQEVTKTVSALDAKTKVIVFKDDQEGREALRSLGYEIEEGKPITGFFDSKNNILAINATESQSDEPFHEGLRPVVKFLKKKNPELFESFAKQAAVMKHPTRGVTYGELFTTPEESLGNMMADVATGYFDRSPDLKGEATNLMQKILESLGVGSPGTALSAEHLSTTATNLATAIRDATGFDADGNRRFRFRIFNTVNIKKVKGEVDIVNEDGRKLKSYPGNELVHVGRADASGNIILACEVLGYRKLLFKLNYDNPFLSEGVERGDVEEAIIPFGLVRLQKGDIAVMYNVYFFRDAAIIRPESKYEINNLMDMMNENPNYKIRLHGHTNGNAAGKIITAGDSKNYFSLAGSKEGRGSAKKLSEERAEVIRQYLIDNGIASERMEIKAWGGKRALYDKNHSLAQSNVRVEVEILEN